MPRRRIKILSKLQKKIYLSLVHNDDTEFDHEFYSRLYPDLHRLKGRKSLLKHYVEHGRREGRFATVDAYMADLVAKYGEAPEDFDPGLYRELNPDLTAQFTDAWQFTAHFLKHGRAEDRRYRLDTSAETAEFTRDAGGMSKDAFLQDHGLAAGRWQLRFDLAQFRQLNADWITTPPATRSEGIRLFVESGIDRLAPINGDSIFDPAFYRAAYPVDRNLDDAALYRHWLSVGIEQNWAPNEAARIFALIGRTAFPECFDVDGYRRSMPASARNSAQGRTQVLEHWLDHGFQEDRLDVVSGQGAADFFALVGRRELLRQRFEASRRAYDEAIRRGGPTPGRLHDRAEAARALGDLAAAAADYRQAARSPGSSVWSHIHAADTLAQTSDLPGAIAQLRASAPLWVRNARWRDTASRIFRQAFDARCQFAREAYRRGLRASGDGIMDEALRQFAADWPLAEPLPAPLPPAQGGTIVMLANLDLPQCVHYRVEQRRRQLEHGGWTVRIFGPGETQAFREALHGASAALFYRVPAFPHILHSILYARALGLATFYDIDDLIFDGPSYPDPFESFEGQISRDEYVGLEFGVPLFRFAMSLCDEGIASTPALAEAMTPVVRSGRVHVVRNALDERNAPFLNRPDPDPAAPGQPVTIFYGSGTKAHNSDFNDLAGPALLAILARHPEVRLVIAGHLKLDPAFAPFEDRIRQLGFTARVADYWEILSGVDINLAVLHPGKTADAKSEIKWLEAAMCGIPSVVSGTRTYREILADGEDVLLADTPEAWEAALERLVTDLKLRHRIGLAARRKARRRYTLDAAVETLAAFLPPPRRPAAPAARTKPRILLVNVFFPPQTIGGATRVVRDNLDHFLDHAGTRFDFSVAASDEGVEPAGCTRIDSYRGIPVLRISTPMEVNMDWRPFNPMIGEIFADFLDRMEPDLVHFHCVQRLTADVVEAVQARGIPHLVTLHDGWWISDHQFLLDRDGRVVRPGPDTLEPAADAPLGVMAQVLRRRRLGHLLRGADRILAVSESFAKLYREAGFPRTISVPNGLPRLEAPERPRGTGPRVRLGHVGGREAHKGAPLIEAVLRTTPFRNLSFTLVDLAQEAGYVGEEIWGTTPVRIVGPVPQSEIGRLYQEFDVLLVPSLWPESFGLVSREARLFGLWVVASDRGAVGEDITPGVDGFVIDVATPGPLRAVLSEIDGDVARFQAPPPRTGPVRSAADQGAELLRLYEEILAGAAARRPAAE
ncbi:glycosyl transferase group 1 [Methylobacterium nodulans ORS 2060]|uniref:Glycosyl transferase group 1 n=1 Tax=Methylobacterium nodulans (strain LMG 21967 / CNCM I-2342 / ORS 2060) TaxID=460265 RepID=B8IPA6_METNO|nr:glycosyl transferase group 1 [Methylobacterium nodulans ORS 2060]